MFVTGVQTCALPIYAGRTPAVLGVVGEQARVKFREALLAVRAVGGRREGAFFALLFDIQNSFAEVQRDSDELFDLSFVLRRDLHRAGRQINVVFCETRQGREAECRDFFPVHNQVLIAFVSCPNRQVLVEALTVFDQIGKSTRLNSSHKHRSRMPSSA